MDFLLFSLPSPFLIFPAFYTSRIQPSVPKGQRLDSDNLAIRFHLPVSIPIITPRHILFRRAPQLGPHFSNHNFPRLKGPPVFRPYKKFHELQLWFCSQKMAQLARGLHLGQQCSHSSILWNEKMENSKSVL